MIAISARLAKIAAHLPIGFETTAKKLAGRCGLPVPEVASALRHGVQDGLLTSTTGPGPAFVTRFTVVGQIAGAPVRKSPGRPKKGASPAAAELRTVEIGRATCFVGGINPWTGKREHL